MPEPARASSGKIFQLREQALKKNFQKHSGVRKLWLQKIFPITHRPTFIRL